MVDSLFCIQFKNQLNLKSYEENQIPEAQIVLMLQQYYSGMKVSDVCRHKAKTTDTFYSWQRKDGDMDAQQPKELKSLQE